MRAHVDPATTPDLRFGAAPMPESFPGFDPAGDARAIMSTATPSPAKDAIPGRQYFASLGPGHRYVVRVPDAWNGKLAVCGTPALRSEHANDGIWSDFLLARGYAYASSNKGIPYNAVTAPWTAATDPGVTYRLPFQLGDTQPDTLGIVSGGLAPKLIPVAGWQADLAALIVAAKDVVGTATGRMPSKTYVAGISIGGGQVRWLLERHPELADGGVEWASVYWSPRENILTYLPAFLAQMPAYFASGYRDRAAHDAIVAAGFPPDRLQDDAAHRSLWDAHYSQPAFYNDITTFIFAKLLDANAGDLATLAARAAYVPSEAASEEIATFAHTGAIERPLIGIAGSADVFITPQHNATPYLEAVRAAGRGDRYWQYLVDGGAHVDSYAERGWKVRPQAPFAWAAFDRLVDIVENGAAPSGAGTARAVSKPSDI
jgi:hypothetical protein